MSTMLTASELQILHGLAIEALGKAHLHAENTLTAGLDDTGPLQTVAIYKQIVDKMTAGIQGWLDQRIPPSRPPHPIEVKLFRFSLPHIKERLYLYSLRSDERWLRSQFNNLDHGDIQYEIWEHLQKFGKIERITSIDQLSEADFVERNEDDDYNTSRDQIPYTCQELNFEPTIERFLHPPYYYK